LTALSLTLPALRRLGQAVAIARSKPDYVTGLRPLNSSDSAQPFCAAYVLERIAVPSRAGLVLHSQALSPINSYVW